MKSNRREKTDSRQASGNGYRSHLRFWEEKTNKQDGLESREIGKAQVT